jgi:hypothetical protein
MIHFRPFVFLILVYLVLLLADEGYYVDTNAISNPDYNLDLSTFNSVLLKISTSHSYLAGTNDPIYATFVGDFSSSGPHSIGTFTQGSKSSMTINLDKKIGDLIEIELFNYGYDGWLLSSLFCQIDDTVYEMTGSRQWIDSLDASSLSLTGNGYEPNDQEGLPAAPSLRLSVHKKFKMYHGSTL